MDDQRCGDCGTSLPLLCSPASNAAPCGTCSASAAAPASMSSESSWTTWSSRRAADLGIVTSQLEHFQYLESSSSAVRHFTSSYQFMDFCCLCFAASAPRSSWQHCPDSRFLGASRPGCSILGPDSGSHPRCSPPSCTSTMAAVLDLTSLDSLEA